MTITSNLPNLKSCTISVIGLGYVGLPLAVEFAKSKTCLRTQTHLNNKIIGFDLNKKRLLNLKNGIDNTKEVPEEVLKGLQNISFTNDVHQLSKADVFIITVPTPINKDKEPDLEAIKSATKTVGQALKVRLIESSDTNLKSSPVIIYESTVYPGTTEEICIPILEKESGLKYNHKEFNQGFFCGYSPERINPSDEIHTLTSIIKVTSGGDPESALWIDDLYGSIIKAGTYRAPSIKVAEAAKVIENTQRDLNIALVNELALIFDKIGIDTQDVLATASTKWNFLKFEPGLVGGHCISVDPYYLTYKSRQVGFYPKVVLAGRKINDNMSYWIAQNLIKELKNRVINNHKKLNVLILGFTFKENCVDIRNTKVFDLINTLVSNDIHCDVYDPWVNKTEVYEMYKLKVLSKLEFNKKYSAVLVAVAHKEFSNIEKKDWESLIVKNGIFYDLKNIIPRSLNPIRL